MQFYEQIKIFDHLMMMEYFMPLPIREEGPSEQWQLPSSGSCPPRVAHFTLLQRSPHTAAVARTQQPLWRFMDGKKATYSNLYKVILEDISLLCAKKVTIALFFNWRGWGLIAAWELH